MNLFADDAFFVNTTSLNRLLAKFKNILPVSKVYGLVSIQELDIKHFIKAYEKENVSCEDEKRTKLCPRSSLSLFELRINCDWLNGASWIVSFRLVLTIDARTPK